MFWKWAEGVSQSLLAGNIVHSGRPSRSTVVSLPYYVFHVIAPQVLASLGLIQLHGSAVDLAGARSIVVSLPYYVFHVIAPQVLASLGLIRLHGSAIGYAGWSKEGSVLPVACIGLHIPV